MRTVKVKLEGIPKFLHGTERINGRRKIWYSIRFVLFVFFFPKYRVAIR